MGGWGKANPKDITIEDLEEAEGLMTRSQQPRNNPNQHEDLLQQLLDGRTLR